MTATLHKLTAGDGYTYLTRQVACADATTRGSSTLADYYSEKGERPGQWIGQGVTGLVDLNVGDTVTEEQMRALFGEGLQPNADEITDAMAEAGASKKAIRAAVALGRAFYTGTDIPELTRVTAQRFQSWNKEHGQHWNAPIPEEVREQIRTTVAKELFEKKYRREPIDARELSGFVAKHSRDERSPVAGYDVTFSPVKSVSALWAVADRSTSETIQAAHDAAVMDALQFLEENMAYTRQGNNGVAQVDVRGIIATKFLHRDTRAGDPDLHTHVAISNKVQREDGSWRALDGRTIHQGLVAVSERYNLALERELNQRLGLSFEPRFGTGREGKREIREVAGISSELLTEWSSRARMIDDRATELASEFTEKHGRTPSPKEMLALRQRANLETREAKHEPRSEAEQREAWKAQAADLLGSQEAVTAMVEHVLGQASVHVAHLDQDSSAALAYQAIRTVESHRARWRDTHLLAEVQRLVKAQNLAPGAVDDAVDQVMATAMGSQSVEPLLAQDTVREPSVLQRRDGSSVYEPAHSRLFTTRETVAAEERLVTAAQQIDGRALRDLDVEIALLESTANGVTLNAGQAALVHDMASSGARLQLALAPAGSGKTTALRVLTRAWESSGGSVIGLAPSAAAAGELESSTGANSDTLAQLTYALQSGRRLPGWADHIDQNTLLIIDEAGMASTRDLDVAVEFAISRGASVRLVGDNQQLASIAAGGALRDIKETVGAVTLSELMRFRDQGEGAATLALRDGDVTALGFYLDNNRVHTSATGSQLDSVFNAWQEDRRSGLDAAMLAYARADVDELNARARAARLAEDGTTSPAEVTLRSGHLAGAGDTIITRRNERSLRSTSTDWVKNGDRWLVQEVREDGSLTAKHLANDAVVLLPSDYVATQVDLGYATTIHAVQGSTVDVAHVALSGVEDRQLLYVATTRGREANHLYLESGGEGDPHRILAPEYVAPRTVTEVLEEIVGRDGSQVSATTTRRDAATPAAQLERITPIYVDALQAAARDLIGPERLSELAEGAQETLEKVWNSQHDQDAEPAPVLAESPSWDFLLSTLATIELDAPSTALTQLESAAADRELDSARDVAVVLDWRLDDALHTITGDGPLPWLHGISKSIQNSPTWGPYLTARAEQVRDTADQLRTEANDWTVGSAPRWARAYVGYGSLASDLAVWRAANQVKPDDLTPAGPTPPVWRLRTIHKSLVKRAEAATGGDSAKGARWVSLLRELGASQVLEDPYWAATLAQRLDTAAAGGIDVPKLLCRSLDSSNGPLPDDHAAAALWWRLARHVAPATLQGGAGMRRVRPGWADQLVAALPDRAEESLLTDPAWPSLVGAVESTARATGAEPADIAITAVSLIGARRIGTPDGVSLDQLATVLAWRVEMLGAPEPVAEEDLPLDPEDEYISPEDQAAAASRRTRQSNRPAGEATDHQEQAQPAVVQDPNQELPEEHVAELAHTSRERIAELNQLAASFYRDHYTGGPANYMAERFGTDLSDRADLVIGYAPAGRSSLSDWLQREHQVTADELVDAGLAKFRASGRLQDVFRDRVVIGLHNSDGTLSGFVGRAAPSASREVPKYLNTPQTALFSKGEVLFGVHEAADAISAGAMIARAEGPMDALAITLAGDGRTVGVAPLGTALTEVQADQLAELAHSTNGRIFEATDTDKAGVAAAEKDYWKLTERGLDPVRLILTNAKDPAQELKDAADAWKADPDTLRLTVTTPDLAPSLAQTLIGQRLSDDQEHLAEGNIFAQASALRDIAKIIAALPPEQWESTISAAVGIMGAPELLPDLAGETLLATADLRPDASPETTQEFAAAVTTVATMAPRDNQLVADRVTRMRERLSAGSETTDTASRLAAIRQRAASATHEESTAQGEQRETEPQPALQPQPKSREVDRPHR